ncbi:MAG: DUF5686 family protein, partial [Bacteroidia bacterium]|nr:DUF5686 family protein [Bacteroidia bacterium]
GLSAQVSTEGLKEGILYLAENVSRVAVREPAKIKEQILASRVSGDSKRYSLFGNLFLRFSIYDNFVELEGLSDRGFISPIADNALFYYDYRLEGIVKEKPVNVYKIRVFPKRRNDPVFAGHLWIRDSTFAVRGLNLNLTGERQLQGLDSLHVAQHYDSNGTPASVRFDFSGGILGLRFGGYSASALSEYDLSPHLPPKFFNNEIISVADTAVRTRVGFWESRPIPLDSLEERDFTQKADVERRKQDPRYLDSLNKARNKFKPIHLLLGYRYSDVRNERAWYLDSPLQFINFNTVEGYCLEWGGGYFQPLGSKQGLNFDAQARYGFASRTFGVKASIALRRGRRRGPFSSSDNFAAIAAGTYVEPFGGRQIVPAVNTFHTLLLKENYLKVYRNVFANIRGQNEIFNGFFAGAAMTYE